MDNSIAKNLGVMTAWLEEDLMEDPTDIDALSRMEKMSAIYHNFSHGGFGNFGPEFERGYELGKADVARDHRIEKSDPVDRPDSPALG